MLLVGDNARRPRKLGEAAFHEEPTPYHALMRRLFVVELRLAAGPDNIASQLFRQLLTAMVHWFTASAK